MLFAVTMLAAIGAAASAQTVFINGNPITFPGGNAGPTNAYPSVIVVSGMNNPQYLTVGLNGVPTTGGTAEAFGCLLVGPTGQTVDLGTIVTGPTGNVTTFNITLADDAASAMPNPVVAAGTYQPGSGIGGNYPSPAPAGPYSRSIASLLSGPVNGTWTLYVFGLGSSRTIATSWRLAFDGPRQPQSIGTAFTYQGKIEKDGAPLTGTADLRFSLWNHPTSTNGGNRTGSPLTRSAVPVTDGLFTTSIDFGGATDDANGLWMDMEVASPPGSSFVSIGPRQRISPTPQAVRALVAGTAETFSITSDARLGDKTMFLRGGSDTNHGLGWFNTTKVFGGLTPDGPVLFGYAGGVLGTKDNSNERPVLRWTNTSRVAVGFLTPNTPLAARLHVQSDNTNDLGLLVSSFGAGWGSGIRLENTSGGARTYGMYSASDGNWYFADQTATATRMLINSAGRIGIGTISPSQSLDVVGGIRARGGGPGGFGANNNGLTFSTPGDDDSGLFSLGDNQVSIFNNATEVVRVTGSNVGIGTTTPSQRLTVNGNVLANNVAVPSSGRFKDHVVPMDDALTSILKLEGVRFDWKPEWAAQRPGREHDIGFVAEDVAKIFPEVVFRDEAGNVTGMDYSRLTAVAVQAIKQQQAQRLKDRAEIDDLKERLKRLELLIEQK
jgi:hypothetical protein